MPPVVDENDATTPDYEYEKELISNRNSDNHHDDKSGGYKLLLHSDNKKKHCEVTAVATIANVTTVSLLSLQHFVCLVLV